MAYTSQWSDDEVEILTAHYRDKGPFWVGWEALLPDRTDRAIQHKANSLGLKSSASRTGTERRRRKVLKRDPVDAMVERMMSDGMAPSEIDERMHWYRGTAIRVITGIWKGSRL